MRYILNSAVIKEQGTYTYRIITAQEAVEWIKKGSFASRVGYDSTAEHIANLSGIKPELNRDPTVMQKGDEALVVRLKYRMQNPGQKGVYQPASDDWEYGILYRKD